MDNTPIVDEVAVPKKNVLFEVTTLSKVLAAVLFIILPFVGFWVGMQYAPQTETVVTTPEEQVQNPAEQVLPIAQPSSDTDEQKAPTAKTAPTIVTANIAALTESEITLDYITVLNGEEAVDTAITDSYCTEAKREQCLSEIKMYFRNTTQNLRTLKLAPDVTFMTWTGEPQTIEFLKTRFPSDASKYDPNAYYEYHRTVTLNANNEVIRVEEFFTP